MNPLQRQILDLADTQDLSGVTYYRIAKLLGVQYPHRVKFALDQLIKKGLIVHNKQTGGVVKTVQAPQLVQVSKLISVPFYGEVNCGQALAYADDAIQGFLKVSPSVLNRRSYADLIALKAVGDSMNQASIGNQSVEEGDYIIAERADRTMLKSGDYVVSLIQGLANLKKLYVDQDNRRLVLRSVSSSEHLPIVISELDADDDSLYMPIARAIEVIKHS